jgi:uncharacterized protein
MTSLSRFSCALVTGASSGLGEEFALQIARWVGRIALVARREDLLDELAVRIRARHPQTAVFVHAADLADTRQRAALIPLLAAKGFTPDLLINNAGLGDYGEFATSDWPRNEAMLRVNIGALTHLTHAVLPHLIRRGGGAIVNVSSLSCLLPIPDFAVYAATKAYVTSFSESLRIELRGHGIQVLAVCPGPVKTGFGEAARRDGASNRMGARKWFYVPKQQVVAEALAALVRGRARVYPGWKTAAAALVLAGLPLVALRFAMGFRPRKSLMAGDA